MTPRQVAAEIIALPTAEQRRARLERCEDWQRPLVQRHVENAFAMAKFKRERS